MAVGARITIRRSWLGAITYEPTYQLYNFTVRPGSGNRFLVVPENHNP